MPELGARDELILASASSGRADILRGAGLAFRQVPASVDERALEAEAVADGLGKNGGKLAQILAVAKAEEVSGRFSTSVVIGVDQVMECDGVIYHKPASREAARAQLAELRGRMHRLHCGLAVARGGRAVWQHLAVARMTMRPFSDVLLDAYCATEDETLLQTVGAYRIEGRGVQLFSDIDGDYFTIIGLPLLPLLNYLRETGWLSR
jgi:septum formation protein